MKELTVESWEEFVARIDELQKNKNERDNSLPNLLFRGQANADWKLATTLERNNRAGMLFTEYYRSISILQPEIETFTNNHWGNPDYPAILQEAAKYEFFRLNKEMHTSIYGYMAHLRHHGLPSPLLDWSRSAYVAAYFAFAHTSVDNHVSIYALSQANAHVSSSNQPEIITFGPRVKTHRRHFLQQCEYSMCVTMADGPWHFTEHENAETDWNEEDEYLVNLQIHKFKIPGQERRKVLKALDQYNLNAFSLFGSEESLMETLAFREFHFESR